MMYPYDVGHTLLPRFYVRVLELKNIYVYKIYNCVELADSVAVCHRNHLVAFASADFTHQCWKCVPQATGYHSFTTHCDGGILLVSHGAERLCGTVLHQCDYLSHWCHQFPFPVSCHDA